MAAGLSQRELARRLGTTQRYIWELGSGKPSILMDRLFAAMRETGMQAVTAARAVPGNLAIAARVAGFPRGIYRVQH